MSNALCRQAHQVLSQLPNLRQDLLAPLELEFHQLFNDFFGDFLSVPTNTALDRMKSKVDFPKIDAYYQDDKFIITAVVAGVDPGDLEVEIVEEVAPSFQVSAKMLIISGRSVEIPQDTKVVRKEIRRSAFRRVIALPQEVDDRPEIGVKDGILTVKWVLPQEQTKESVRRTLLWGSAGNSQVEEEKKKPHWLSNEEVAEIFKKKVSREEQLKEANKLAGTDKEDMKELSRAEIDEIRKKSWH